MFPLMLPLMNWAPQMPLKLKPKLIWLMWMRSSTEEVTEEVAQTTQETTAEVAPIFEVETAEVVESVDENTTEISLASFAVVNPGEQNYTVTVEGEGSEAFTYNEETNSLEITEELGP